MRHSVALRINSLDKLVFGKSAFKVVALVFALSEVKAQLAAAALCRSSRFVHLRHIPATISPQFCPISASKKSISPG